MKNLKDIPKGEHNAMTKVLQTKICQNCGKEFERPRTVYGKRWKNRKYCTKKCRNEAATKNSKFKPPTTYKGKAWFEKNLNKYLKLREDVENQKLRQERRGDKPYQIYEYPITVKLPTVEGFADFIGVTKTTLYNWAKEHAEVKGGIDKIITEQLTKLIDNGLQGTYNSTIAKLILSSNHGMREGIDAMMGGKILNKFDDKQIDRIIDRLARRKRGGGDIPSEKKSN